MILTFLSVKKPFTTQTALFKGERMVPQPQVSISTSDFKLNQLKGFLVEPLKSETTKRSNIHLVSWNQGDTLMIVANFSQC